MLIKIRYPDIETSELNLQKGEYQYKISPNCFMNYLVEGSLRREYSCIETKQNYTNNENYINIHKNVSTSQKCEMFICPITSVWEKSEFLYYAQCLACYTFAICFLVSYLSFNLFFSFVLQPFFNARGKLVRPALQYPGNVRRTES